MTSHFPLRVLLALFIAVAFLLLVTGQTLTADSRPEYISSCASKPTTCNPFSNCRTWVTGTASNGNIIGAYPSGTAATLGTPTVGTSTLATGYGFNYYQPWPSSTNQQVSGLTFSGHKAQNITFNAWFPVAMLTHVNFPISAPPTQICNLLSLTIPFYLTYTSTSGTVSTTSTTFPVSFTVEETPNSPCSTYYGKKNTSSQAYPAGWQNLNGVSQCPYGPTCSACYGNGCNGCSYTCPCEDKVALSGGYTNNQVLTLGGKSFFMAVLGFTMSSSFSSSDTPVSFFATVENANTTGYLYARLVQTCTTNTDCDDGVSCTTDQCLSASSSLNTGGYTQNFCYYTYDNTACTNGCVTGTCTATGCNISSTTACSGYIAPVINCMTCSTSTGTCLVSLGYSVSGTPVADSTGVVSIEPTTSNNFFVVNGKTSIDLGQPRNFYVTGASSTVYSAGYITVPMSGSSATVSWTLSGLTVSLDQTTVCSGWGSCVTPSTPIAASLFSSLSTYLAVSSAASTYTFWYNFTVASTPTCVSSSSTAVKLQSFVLKVPTCSSGLTILSTSDGCVSSRISSGGAYLNPSNIATVDPTISGASCLFDSNDGNMGFNGYDGFDIPLNNVGAGQTCLIGLQVNYKTCPNVGWSATNSITSSGRVSVVTNKACTENCGACNTLPIFGPISTVCGGSQPSCTGSYNYLDSSTCSCASCQNTACSQGYAMDTTCTCVACPAPSCPSGQQPSSNYCDKTCVACPSPCTCSASSSTCYQRINYTNSQCGTCYTCPAKANYTITAGTTGCSYTPCSLTCDTDYYTYPSDMCGSCVQCDAAAIAVTCGLNATNTNHPCYCTPCTQGTCPNGQTLANPASTCNSTCVACPTCPGNSTYTDSTKQCTNGGTCQQCPLTACAPDYAPDPANLCNCIPCAACANGTRTNTTWSCQCTSCDKGCSTATGSVNGVDCSRGCTDPNNLCSDCVKCTLPSCPANKTFTTNYCQGCVDCSVTCSAGRILNPTNSCACVVCSASSSAVGYVPCPANSSLNTATCLCEPCTAPTCSAPSQQNYADNCASGCITCTASTNCPVNQTWDGVSYCNPCVDCPINTTNCAAGFVYIAPTAVNACPVCANCSDLYSNVTCPLNQTRSSNPCVSDCVDCPLKTRYANYQVNYTDLCQPLYYCDPAVTNASCPANYTVDPTDSCFCKACTQVSCPTDYKATSNACAACQECPAVDCGANKTQGDDTCNPCTDCPVPTCGDSSQPNWANLCTGCVACEKSQTVCPVNYTVNLTNTCSCMQCADPQCSGNFKYNSSNNLCDGCVYCPLPVCPTNFTREGLTSNCQDCVPCTAPTCGPSTILTIQPGACPYCAACVPGVNVPTCAGNYRVDSDDSCLCEACVAPSCGTNFTANSSNTCAPCSECPAPTCTANYTLFDTCQGCVPCTTVCGAGSVYTDPLDICKGCTACPLPTCGYGLEVANDLCTCTACDAPLCPAGFEIDSTTGCGCASCSGIVCPLGTVLNSADCECEVLTIYNQPNVTTTRCNASSRDACGICYGNNNTCIGCDGQIGSGRYIDACGIVCGTGTTCSGCTGDSCAICTQKVDLCGVCGGNSSTCDGCDGVAASGAVYDICGVCAGNGTSCLGCYGVPFGPACSNAITPGEAAAVSVLVALASLGCVILALIIWRMRSRPELLFQEWDNLIQEHLTEIQANPIFTSADTEINPIFGQNNN